MQYHHSYKIVSNSQNEMKKKFPYKSMGQEQEIFLLYGPEIQSLNLINLSLLNLSCN